MASLQSSLFSLALKSRVRLASILVLRCILLLLPLLLTFPVSPLSHTSHTRCPFCSQFHRISPHTILTSQLQSSSAIFSERIRSFMLTIHFPFFPWELHRHGWGTAWPWVRYYMGTAWARVRYHMGTAWAWVGFLKPTIIQNVHIVNQWPTSVHLWPNIQRLNGCYFSTIQCQVH